jgi:acetolactate synthase-1/2/3 large subunit
MGKDAFDRRAFLKGAAVSAAAAIGTQIAAASKPAEAAESNSGSRDGAPSRDKVIGRPGSDFMVDVIKATGIEYIASNPGSSFPQPARIHYQLWRQQEAGVSDLHP